MIFVALYGSSSSRKAVKKQLGYLFDWSRWKLLLVLRIVCLIETWMIKKYRYIHAKILNFQNRRSTRHSSSLINHNTNNKLGTGTSHCFLVLELYRHHSKIFYHQLSLIMTTFSRFCNFVGLVLPLFLVNVDYCGGQGFAGRPDRRQEVLEYDTSNADAVQFQCAPLNDTSPFNPRCNLDPSGCDDWICSGSASLTYCDSEFFVPGRTSDTYQVFNCIEGNVATCDSACTCITGTYVGSGSRLIFEPDGGECTILNAEDGSLAPYPTEAPSAASPGQPTATTPTPAPAPSGKPVGTEAPTIFSGASSLSVSSNTVLSLMPAVLAGCMTHFIV
jgi:hypothetical protein